MGKVIKFPSGKVIKEIVEEGTKKTGRAAKNISKAIDDDIAKGLSKKSAQNSANIFVEAGESKLESLLRMAGDDAASTKSILRNYKKNGGNFRASSTSDIGKSAAEKSAEVFQKATHSGNDIGRVIGDKNPLYVKTGGDIDKTYQEVSRVVGDRDKAAFLSTESGLISSIDEAYNAGSNNAKSPILNKKEELENLKYEIKNKEGLSSENATGSGNKAQKRADEIKAKEKAKRERLEKTKDERLKNIQNEMEEAGMFGHRPEGAILDSKELKGKMRDSKDDYMRYKAAREHDEALKILDLKEKKPNKFEEKARNNEILNKFKGDNDNYNHITKDQINRSRTKAIRGASADQMGLTDYMGYHKVPERVAAGASTFWLVNKLASSNGQQTNAQLYGQQPYY